MRPAATCTDCAIGDHNAHGTIATDLEQKARAFDASDHGFTCDRETVAQQREHAPEDHFKRADAHACSLQHQRVTCIAKAQHGGRIGAGFDFVAWQQLHQPLYRDLAPATPDAHAGRGGVSSLPARVSARHFARDLPQLNRRANRFAHTGAAHQCQQQRHQNQPAISAAR